GRRRAGARRRLTHGRRRAGARHLAVRAAAVRSAPAGARSPARAHPSDAEASVAFMDDVREALREGLREEAAPISRRLAEVKGLSWNTVGRLERIEQTML